MAATVSGIERAGGAALGRAADVRDAAVVSRTFAEVEQTLGPVDLLVNKEGALGPLGPFWDADLDAWRDAIEVVLWSHVLCTRMILPGMMAAEARAHGVAMFAIGPGTVPRAMSEHALTSPEGRRWLPWFSRVFQAGLDVPAGHAARLVVTRASGKADALTGRFLRVSDDVDAILANVAEVERDKLYSLRIRDLPSSGRDGTRCAILDAAEQP